jgi:hypothetical protein
MVNSSEYNKMGCLGSKDSTKNSVIAVQASSASGKFNPEEQWNVDTTTLDKQVAR